MKWIQCWGIILSSRCDQLSPFIWRRKSSKATQLLDMPTGQQNEQIFKFASFHKLTGSKQRNTSRLDTFRPLWPTKGGDIIIAQEVRAFSFHAHAAHLDPMSRICTDSAGNILMEQIVGQLCDASRCYQPAAESDVDCLNVTTWLKRPVALTELLKFVLR